MIDAIPFEEAVYMFAQKYIEQQFKGVAYLFSSGMNKDNFDEHDGQLDICENTYLGIKNKDTTSKICYNYYKENITDGSDGSGDWGHEGRPGKVGGSKGGGGKQYRQTKSNGEYTSAAKKASVQKAIRKADTKCDELRKKYTEAKKAKDEYDTLVFQANYNLDIARKEKQYTAKLLEKAKAEVEKYDTGASSAELEERMLKTQKEIDELYKWIEDHPRKRGESPEDIQDRSEKREQVSRKVDEFLRDSSEKASKEELERVKQSYEEASKRVSDLEISFEDKFKHDPSISIEEYMNQYDQAAQERNKAVLAAYPTAADCDSSQAVTDYLIARQLFNQDQGMMVADKNVDLTPLPTERAVAQAQEIERFFDDYPKLIGKFDGIECHDMSKDTENASAYAYTSGKKVSLNEAFYGTNGNVEDAYLAEVQTKYSPAGTDYRAVIDHEFTHVIENILNEYYGGNEKVSDVVMRRVQERKDGVYDPKNEQVYRLSVSIYAGENKGVRLNEKSELVINQRYGANREFLAEAMAEARCSSFPRETATIVREELEKIMGEAGII